MLWAGVRVRLRSFLAHSDWDSKVSLPPSAQCDVVGGTGAALLWGAYIPNIHRYRWQVQVSLARSWRGLPRPMGWSLGVADRAHVPAACLRA